jgi:hypothetical protein
LKVGKFSLHVSQLFVQSAAHRRARLQAVSSQTQETSNFVEFETQTLYSAYESQCLQVVFTVLPEAALRPGSAAKQGVSLIKANRVDAETDLFRDDSNLHYLDSSLKATPWSIVQSQALLSDVFALDDCLSRLWRSSPVPTISAVRASAPTRLFTN